MLKGYKLTLLYLILSLGTHFLYRNLDLKGDMTVLIVISILFAVFSLGKFIWTNDKKTKLAFILTTLCFVTIAVKIDYVYHNKFISFGLLLVTVYFLVKRDFSLPLRRTILSISILTLVIVLIPDKQIKSYTYYRLLTNGEQISWDDFKAMPNQERGNTARLRANLLYDISEVYDYPSGIVLSYVEPYESWVKHRTDEPSFDLLLHHEQVHFYISEYCARLANDSLRTTWANKEKTKSIISAFFSKMDSIQTMYDSLTKHGAQVDKQFEWTKDIKDKLGIPSLPNDIENIPYTMDRDTTNAR